jgi:hypothetical protein
MKAAVLLLLLALPLGAQTQTVCGPDPSADKDPSLGDFARQHRKAPASHSKFTLTDDDLTPKLPIPDIAVDGDNNDKEIGDAYRNYYDAHTRQEIDRTVHAWYDSQVTAYDRLRDEVAHIQSAQQGNYYYNQYPQYPPDEPFDPQKMREQAALAQAGMQADQRTTQRDQMQMSRIQGALVRLRMVVDPQGKRYDWFNTNLFQRQ